MSLFKRRYKTPSGQLYTLFDEMAQQPHVLIAGATGSGKSVLENGILFNLMHNGPSESQLILIDPKQNELIDYKDFPHTLYYAQSEYNRHGKNEWLKALQMALRIVQERCEENGKKRQKMYVGSDVYLVIDELAFLMTSNNKKLYIPILKQLGMIARAARVHIIALTQTVKADVLPTTLTCNFDYRVALRTATAQQSRMIIDCNCCECLPDPRSEHRAQCFIRDGANLQLWNVPKYDDRQYTDLINWWTSRRCVA